MWPSARTVTLLAAALNGEPLAGVPLARGKRFCPGWLPLWDMKLNSWQRLASQIANRNMTRAEWRQYFPDTPYRPTFDKTFRNRLRRTRGVRAHLAPRGEDRPRARPEVI